MMERLLHYFWQHHAYPLRQLFSTDGERIEVVNQGLRNENSGPDFFNAQIKIDDIMWEGNVEIHSYSSDWFKHGHHNDANYDNVILHVVEHVDMDIVTSKGRKVPQLVLKVPNYIEIQYNELLREENNPPCHQVLNDIPKVKLRNWLDFLFTERLEMKTVRIISMVERFGGDWEKAMFASLARSFGFGINGDVFEEWATELSLSAASKHRDNSFQVEAMFFGTAGLLDDDTLPLVHRNQALNDAYYIQLKEEYKYLKHKFSLSSINGTRWRFLRLRPQNFPYIRLSQLVFLFAHKHIDLSTLMSVTTVKQVYDLLNAEVTSYWQNHYVFGMESAKSSKSLSINSIDNIIINTIIPMLFAWGTHRESETHREMALTMLQNLRAEKNHIVSTWKLSGLIAHNAAESQSIIQLTTEYCNRKDCLRCMFGMEYFNQTEIYPTLNEPDNA